MPKKKEKEPDRVLILGKPDYERCDNQVVTSRYTLLTFIPVAILEQFRRFANLYFLVIGFIMAIGYYTTLFESAISPWTTLGPLAFVISISLLVEGTADIKRHRNDMETNNAPCVVLRRADEMDEEEKAERDPKIIKGRDCVVSFGQYLGDSTPVQQQPQAEGKSSNSKKHKHNNHSQSGSNNNNKNTSTPAGNAAGRNSVRVAFQKVRRMDIHQGHLILVKNREMVPADMVLLASCNDHGSAFIETSSIDGETNLKLRLSPQLPQRYLKALREGTLDAIKEGGPEDFDGGDDDAYRDECASEAMVRIDSIEDATKRLTRFSYLGRPNGRIALDHPDYKGTKPAEVRYNNDGRPRSGLFSRIATSVRRRSTMSQQQQQKQQHGPSSAGGAAGIFGRDDTYVAALTTEPPNPSVHTFLGKITLPPLKAGAAPLDVALDAENVLLRGAVVRNTEWVIGVVFFTGTDTKLVQNSVKTKSKFSQLDILLNKTVVAILFIMIICIVYLATSALVTTNSRFDELWYAGYNRDETATWPYLQNLAPPKWRTKSSNWVQYFFLNVTLLNNFVPLSLYVTVEFVTACMLVFVYADINMYDDTTNTRAVARSTIVSDLGRIQYIFSDKTGTLTQNVMRFKRCSVDGMVFGAPIQKSRPVGEGEQNENLLEKGERSVFHPLRQLLVGRFKAPGQQASAAGLENLGGSTSSDPPSSGLGTSGQLLTFNAEMFLRVMSLCHTVVVEKDIDQKEGIGGNDSVQSSASKRGLGFFNRVRTNTNDSLPPVAEEGEGEEPKLVDIDFSSADVNSTAGRSRTSSVDSLRPGQDPCTKKSDDGAPAGYAYQAESPDEGALVSAASKTYGFQVISRDSSGITLRLASPSHLQNSNVAQGLKSGALSMKRLAAESAEEIDQNRVIEKSVIESSLLREPRKETWTILAVNKFDSDRKRMSILLRSPRELGDVPVLFCKGADTAMLDPEVCSSTGWLHDTGSGNISGGNTSPQRPSAITHGERVSSIMSTLSEGTAESNGGDDDEGANRLREDEWEIAQLLGLQAHLGDFASEGLRTLVLGMRVLTDYECSEWMEEYKAASTALKNRAELLSKAASNIERKIHIVGATAIEDKLQTRVPETIATLGKAGIKLWVLTGDKRETAVEIGYSTHVLSPKMHLTEVPDNGKVHVRTQMAMEFMRLVKMGKLVDYQKSALQGQGSGGMRQLLQDLSFCAGKCWRAFRRWISGLFSCFYSVCGCRGRADDITEDLKERRAKERTTLKPIDLRRMVRASAEKQIKKWLASDEGKKQAGARNNGGEDDISLASEETPAVFSRASSAKLLLNDLKNSGRLSGVQLRELSLAQLTVNQVGDEEPLVDEDTLSMDSFFPGNKEDLRGDFDKKKRTMLERLFAVDRDVRKGKLVKHVKSERLASIAERGGPFKGDKPTGSSRDVHGPRALVIEGAALKHLLGDQEMEAILFAVASNCDAVIACRVSPKQKAQLLNLVRLNVKPEPITLAIGDGANDVGMIQEAHVGVGISGKEGKQAVNSSDFAIAQFRFLEDLLLIHGRWNFFRQSCVILFSFYKNATMACMLIVFADETLFSGTPLFDEWLIAMLNFVAVVPIIVLGLFDRCLDKDYVRAHPEVYKATQTNELITIRTVSRWVLLMIVHVFGLYYFTVGRSSMVTGGGTTPAWQGLMARKTWEGPGNGEGGDLKSVGTVSYTVMVILFAYKVLYESKSHIHGRWPAFTCKKGLKEGFWSRLAYTFHGVVFGSIGFYLWAITVYAVIGRIKPSQFSAFTDVTFNVLGQRSFSWILIIFIPFTLIAFDVVGKLFSNMFYPTQTQIHMEIEQKEKATNFMRSVLRRESWRRTQAAQPQAQQQDFTVTSV